MIFTLIGLIVGLMMGITGAGGAIIAIPLFQTLLSSSLKEATVLSLITVLLGTGANLIGRTDEVKWKIVLTLAISGSVANYFSMPLKMKMPEFVIAILLVMIGVYSIWSVWSSSGQDKRANKNIHYLVVIVMGLLLGLVTTLTGLGGGVLLIPILLKVFGMNYEEALPTSLSSIMLISLSSLIIQGHQTLELINFTEIFFIGLGALSSFAGLSLLLKRISPANKLNLRKYVFTLATVASLAIIILKTL